MVPSTAAARRQMFQPAPLANEDQRENIHETLLRRPRSHWIHIIGQQTSSASLKELASIARTRSRPPITLLRIHFLFRHSKLDAYSRCLRHVFILVCFIILEFWQILLNKERRIHIHICVYI